MRIYKNRYASAIPILSMLTVALGGITFTPPVIAETHATPSNPSTAIVYNSAMFNYRALDGSKKIGWKQSNDTVGKIGGWRTYANEAYKANNPQQNKASEDSNSNDAQAETSVVASAVPTNSAVKKPMMSIAKEADSQVMDSNEKMIIDKSATDPGLSLSYESVTNKHREYEEVTLQDWKSANDRVGKIGGWRAYAKEAYKANQEEAATAGASE